MDEKLNKADEGHCITKALYKKHLIRCNIVTHNMAYLTLPNKDCHVS